MKTRKPRPKTTGELIGVRVQPNLLGKLDDWRRLQKDLPGRSEAIRRLVELGLERLNLSPDMLSDLDRWIAEKTSAGASWDRQEAILAILQREFDHYSSRWARKDAAAKRNRGA
jgi:hypothetical protein